MEIARARDGRGDGTTDGEVARLRRVYAGYQASEAVRGRWAAENAGNRAIAAERDRLFARLLDEAGYLPLAERRVLDVGCGSGHVLAGLQALGARPERLFGVDLRPEAVARAREQYPQLHFGTGNAEVLDFEDRSFDLVLLFTVLSSVLEERMARSLADEADRVLAPGGAVLWYDIRVNNWSNPNVRGVSRQRIAALFPGYRMQIRKLTLLPPLARRLGPLTPVLYPALSSMPWLRTHYAGLLIKPS